MSLKITNKQIQYPLSGSVSGSFYGPLNANGLIENVSYIDFINNIVAPAWKNGRVWWDSENGCLSIYNEEPDITLQVGQEIYLRAYNYTGNTITNGSAVRISGSQGNRPKIVLAQSIDQVTEYIDKNDIIGLATHDIENNNVGYVTTFGLVNGLKTNYSGWNEGDLLWVSSSAGHLTNIPPVAPLDKTFVGILVNTHPNNGKIFVSPRPPMHFHDISSVSASNITQGDIWMFQASGSSGVWKNTKQLSGSYLLTGSLNINGSVTGSLHGTSSFAVSSSVNFLQSAILSNQTVGGLTSGTTLPIGTSIENILRQILITYIPPTLSSLTIRLGGSTISTSARDVGNSFTINSASFSATADNPTGIFPLSASFTGSAADIGTFSYYFGNNVLSTSNVLSLGSIYTINRATTSGTVTFTVNGRRSDTGALITGASTSISFQWRNYLAASSTVISNNSDAQSVINSNVVTSILDTDRIWTATCNANNNIDGNYTYIIYPSSYGDLTNIIQNGATPVLDAFKKLGDFNITNAYSATISVRIYISNSDKAFASGTTLAIS